MTDLEKLLAEATESSVPGYFLTRSGRVISTWNWRGYGPRVLSAFPNSHGYPSVKVKLPSGGMKKMLIHKEVCAAFHGQKPSPDHEVRHLNGNPADNRYENLAWGTRSENARDRKAHGTCMAAENGKRGAPKVSAARRAALSEIAKLTGGRDAD